MSSIVEKFHSSRFLESNVHESRGRRWKGLQQDDDGKETVENC